MVKALAYHQCGTDSIPSLMSLYGVGLGAFGSRDGAVVRALASHRCDSGSILGLDAICGWSLLSVLFSASRGFSPGTLVFPSPQKPTFPNSNSIHNSVDE